MRNIIYKIAIVFLVLIITSCGKDFLDLSPNEAIRTEDAIQSLDDLQASVVGIYHKMQDPNYYGRYFVLVPDVMSDDVKQNASANRAKEYAEYEAFADHFITENMWRDIYEVIAAANSVINTSLEVNAAVQSEMDQLVGEALAARALAHFDLVRIYGQHYGFTADNSHPGVPIVLEFDQDAEPTRASVAQVYNQVISDLDAAIGKMNENKGTGFFSANAARAIKARVMLYMGNYGEAENLASAVINSGDYSLVSTDSYVDTWRAGNAPDAILEVIMNETDNFGSDALGRMYIVDGYGDYLPSQEVLDLIPEGDVRGELFKADENLGGIFGELRVDKYPSVLGEDNTAIVRLAEMYMIRAEARFRTGNETGAQEDVNAIRQRANPAAEPVTATGDALLQEIINEKRVELMYEGHRLWDLMRWNMDIVRDDCTSPICTINYPNDRVILPIPQEEIFANPNMSQNPGY